MVEVNKDKKEHGIKANRGVKQLPCLDDCAFLSVEQKDTAGTWLQPATQYCIMFKNGSHYLETLGRSHGSTASFPQTISGGSIPKHVAQFARITCQDVGFVFMPVLKV